MSPVPGELAIGPLQEDIWRFWDRHRTSPVYTMPEVFHYDGDFDVQAAEFAFNAMIQRHEALRTVFRKTDAGVVQAVQDPDPQPVELLDLRASAEDVRQQELQAAIDAVSVRPFDLETGPPIRAAAIRVRDDLTWLVLVVHQIACDGESMVIALEDFGELYRSVRRQTPPELAPATPGYSDFVRDQLAALAEGGLADEAEFWEERLAGMSGSALPGTEPAAERDSAVLDLVLLPTMLPSALSAAVQAFARSVGATPFSVLLCAMDVMIAAATGDGDVAIGTVTSVRTPRFARTVGMLTNTVVQRARIDLSRSFADVLGDVSLDLMDSLDYQELPFTRAIGGLRKSGEALGSALIRTMFYAGAVGGLTLDGGNVADVVTSPTQGLYDLSAVCEITPEHIAVDWKFALSTYSEQAAHGYRAAYEEILAALVDQPEAAMDSLALVEIAARPVAARPVAAGAVTAGTVAAGTNQTPEPILATVPSHSPLAEDNR